MGKKYKLIKKSTKQVLSKDKLDDVPSTHACNKPSVLEKDCRCAIFGDNMDLGTKPDQRCSGERLRAITNSIFTKDD